MDQSRGAGTVQLFPPGIPIAVIPKALTTRNLSVLAYLGKPWALLPFVFTLNFWPRFDKSLNPNFIAPRFVGGGHDHRISVLCKLLFVVIPHLMIGRQYHHLELMRKSDHTSVFYTLLAFSNRSTLSLEMRGELFQHKPPSG
jgi:hypothetical protein